ncbi:MAG: hypothetical protein AAGE61_15035 [Pseudomonadota bacterium]
MARKSQKGSGGKRGHSNQDNWMTHQEEKDLGRRLRRLEEKAEIRAARLDHETEPESRSDD